MTFWAVGRFDLRLSEEEFWQMSPQEFMALHDRWIVEQELQDSRAALITATIINGIGAFGSKRRKQVEPKDLMPDRRGGEKSEKAQSVEAQIALVEMLNEAFGGEDLRKKSSG